MSINDLFRKMKAKLNPQSNKIAQKDAPKEESPSDFNSALFKKFYDDLHRNALPNVPEPTDDEIMKCKLSRQGLLEGKNPYASPVDQIMLQSNMPSPVDLTKLQSNMAIPVEVEIWVDKVSAYYFDDLRPMLGLTHGCNRATKELYKYKGYDWYSISEIFPLVMFD